MNRYHKQFQLPNWSDKEQKILASSSILVIGAGGLANAALPYLAMAGIGKILIADGDKIEWTNLARQALFTENEIGLNKAEVVARKLKALNSSIHINFIPDFIKKSNLKDFLTEIDLILDCTDNFAIRYIINDLAVEKNIPWIYAGIYGWEGQISVLNGEVYGENRKGASYRCLFPDPPAAMEIPDCDTAGVLGTTVGFIGIQQAREAIFYLLKWESKANGHLINWNCMTMESYAIKLYQSAI